MCVVLQRDGYPFISKEKYNSNLLKKYINKGLVIFPIKNHIRASDQREE